MSRRIITTKFRGACYECGEEIEPGDRIVWESDTGITWHADCDRTLPASQRATEREMNNENNNA